MAEKVSSDKSEYTLSGEKANRSLSIKEPSDWQCFVVNDNFVIRPNKGNEPNAFHRFMQELILGFKWRKVK